MPDSCWMRSSRRCPIIDQFGDRLPVSTFTPGPNSGCVPLNILGENAFDPAARQFFIADLNNLYRLQQHVVSGSISGDFGALFSLPGGPVGFAIGAEYRKEQSDYTPDPLQRAGALKDTGLVAPLRGGFDVKEVFGELRAPLLKDVPFARTLEVNAALRKSDYSTVGRTTAWQVNGVWAPVADVRFRGGYSQSVRAPNINELFAPQTGIIDFVSDPCDPSNIVFGTQFRVANCRAALTAAGLSAARIAAFQPANDLIATSAQSGFTGGNAGLSPETAKTWTVGVMIAPSFVPGLEISADWYNIRLTDAVNTPSLQAVANLCVDQPTLDNPFCANIGRSTTTGYINRFFVRPQNVAAFRTQGLDVVVNYRFDAGAAGLFNVRLVGNYLNRLDFVSTPGADRLNDLNNARYPAPEYSGVFDLTWTKGPFSLNYGLLYQSPLVRFSPQEVAANPTIAEPRFLSFRARWEHDVQASVAVNDRFSFYVGANNLTGKEADVASIAIPYGTIGRFYYAGARMSFGRSR